MRMTLYDALCGGALDLPEDAVDHCLAQIRRHHGKADWFKRHESPEPLHLKELQFAGCASSVDRLVAHFINGGHDLEDHRSASVPPGRPRPHPQRHRERGAVADGTPSSSSACALSPEDRATSRTWSCSRRGRSPGTWSLRSDPADEELHPDVRALEILLQRDRHHFLEVGQPFEHFSDPVLLQVQHPGFAPAFASTSAGAFCCTSFRTGGVITRNSWMAMRPRLARVEARLAAFAARERQFLAVDFQRVEAGVVAELLLELR